MRVRECVNICMSTGDLISVPCEPRRHISSIFPSTCATWTNMLLESFQNKSTVACLREFPASSWTPFPDAVPRPIPGAGVSLVSPLGLCRADLAKTITRFLRRIMVRFPPLFSPGNNSTVCIPVSSLCPEAVLFSWEKRVRPSSRCFPSTNRTLCPLI